MNKGSSRGSFLTIFSMGLILLLGGCRMNGKIPMIGIDENGKEFKKYFFTKDVADDMGKALATVQNKTLVSLESRTIHSPWELSRVDVGFGVGAELGFMAFKIGATPFFVLRFEKK